jgi:hypothetical protein
MTQFQKNNTLGGRKAGSINVVTKEVRESFSMLLQGNLEHLQTSLDDVRAVNPEAFCKLLISMAQFVIPKMQPQQIIEQTTPTTYKVTFES